MKDWVLNASLEVDSSMDCSFDLNESSPLTSLKIFRSLQINRNQGVDDLKRAP
jgi:hypothetical protein